MFNFLKKQKGTGALIDSRQRSEKEKDYRLEEIVSSPNAVNWREKSKDELRRFPIFDQNGSGSCVAQTAAKLLGIMYKQNTKDNFVWFSATHIYQRRKNAPSSGMIGVDCLNILREGVTLEDLVPSQDMTDSEMDNKKIEDHEKQVGRIFKIGNYVKLPVQNIETVASVIQTTGKGVMVWFYFERDEWTTVPKVKRDVSLRGSKTSRHSVTAVDFTLHNGEKALVIEDSWGNKYGDKGQRIITEKFFKKRNFFAAYPINFSFDSEEEDTSKPTHTFTETLKYSPTYNQNSDVVKLQDILKFEGLFPKNVDSTGYYGAITAKAVDAFQRKYEVADTAELDSLQGRRVGQKTLEKLNELYGR